MSTITVIDNNMNICNQLKHSFYKRFLSRNPSYVIASGAIVRIGVRQPFIYPAVTVDVLALVTQSFDISNETMKNIRLKPINIDKFFNPFYSSMTDRLILSKSRIMSIQTIHPDMYDDYDVNICEVYLSGDQD